MAGVHSFVGRKKSSPGAYFTNGETSDFQISPTDATASLTVSNDGTVYGTGVWSNFNWLLSGVASDYEIRATLQSGPSGTGTYNTWLGLGSSRSWSLTNTQNSTSVVQNVVRFEIRRASNQTLQASGDITFTATVDL